jgi:exodeoxyribonuclease-3
MKQPMRIVTFNANGIRSAAAKGFFRWFKRSDADVLCLQETKAQAHQLAHERFRPPGYHVHFRDATTKKGYSGVAIYSRREPDEVRTALGWRAFDEEGRYLEARFGDLSVVSLYFPSGSSGEPRQRFKFRSIKWMTPILDEWLHSGRKYVVCGDWNIVHTRLDIRNWTSNQKNSGCLPRERAWLDLLFGERGWVDSYRHLRPEGEDYTWWSQRGAARKKNVGWRIDYQVVTPNLRGSLRDCAITPTPRFSDHAPYAVDYHP